jgi:hypothetical protein
MSKKKRGNTNPIGKKRGHYATNRVKVELVRNNEDGKVIAIFRGRLKGRPMTERQMAHALAVEFRQTA